MSDSDFNPELSGMHSQDEEIAPQEEIIPSLPAHHGLNPMIILLALGVSGLVGWKIYSVVQENQPVYQEEYLPQKEVSVKVLLPEMQEYMRQNYPSDGRRLVIYAPELNSDTCPFRREFVQSFNREKDNPQWQASYKFVPQVRQVSALSRKELDVKLKNLRNFMEKVCGYICIADIQENWVFEIQRGSTLIDALYTPSASFTIGKAFSS